MICNNTISYIPIIGCTAHEDYESHLQCFNAGMIHVVVKPVFIKSLQEAFSRIQELKFSETIRE
jgi:CheY-like chemotaxis protein